MSQTDSGTGGAAFDLSAAKKCDHRDELIDALKSNVEGAKRIYEIGSRMADLMDLLVSVLKHNSAELAQFRVEQQKFQQLFAQHMESSVVRVEKTLGEFASRAKPSAACAPASGVSESEIDLAASDAARTNLP